jgi:hypothetical protein
VGAEEGDKRHAVATSCLVVIASPSLLALCLPQQDSSKLPRTPGDICVFLSTRHTCQRALIWL